MEAELRVLASASNSISFERNQRNADAEPFALDHRPANRARIFVSNETRADEVHFVGASGSPLRGLRPAVVTKPDHRQPLVTKLFPVLLGRQDRHAAPTELLARDLERIRLVFADVE